MNFKRSQVNIALGSEIGFNDNDQKMLWALINDALRRGEEVPARIRAVSTTLDQRTLMKRGEDERGLPIFGIGGNTRLSLGVELSVDVSVPVPEEKQVTAVVKEEVKAAIE